MDETIDIMTLSESEHEPNCTGDLEASQCHPETCRKFDVFVPITVTPFGRPDKDHITVTCNGDLRTIPGNQCQGQGPTAHEFTVAQEIKVLIPVKFGAEVCFDESCDEDLGDCQGVDPSHVTLCHSSLKLDRYRTHQLEAAVHPENARDKSVTWTSNYPNYATVSPSGLVTAVRKGRARITATTVNGKMAYCDVEVEDEDD